MLRDHLTRKTSRCQACSWETEDEIPAPPFAGKSLEEEVAGGDEAERSQANWTLRVSVNGAPLFVNTTVSNLRRKQGNLATRGDVTRYATRTGIKVVKQMPQIKKLRHLAQRAYRQGDESLQMHFLGHRYDMAHRISSNKRFLNCYVYGWVGAAIFDIADDSGLPGSTVALMALVAGLAQSVVWVPSRYGDLFEFEVEHFSEYLTERVDVATGKMQSRGT